MDERWVGGKEREMGWDEIKVREKGDDILIRCGSYLDTHLDPIHCTKK